MKHRGKIAASAAGTEPWDGALVCKPAYDPSDEIKPLVYYVLR